MGTKNNGLLPLNLYVNIASKYFNKKRTIALLAGLLRIKNRNDVKFIIIFYRTSQIILNPDQFWVEIKRSERSNSLKFASLFY